MTNIINFFVDIFGNNSALATAIVSTFPLIELRGAIPFGMSEEWGPFALSGWQALFYALLGSCLVVPILALIFNPIITWLKQTKLFKKIVTTFENVLQKKSTKIIKDLDEKNTKYRYFYTCLGIFAFVAVPLPLTGIWTGTCIAVILGLKFRDILISVIGGNICAGLIMTLISSISGSASIVFFVYIILILLFVSFAILKYFISKKQRKNMATSSPIMEKQNQNTMSQPNSIKDNENNNLD